MDRNTMFPRSIRYLLAVAEHQSFTRAAEALSVSQPTLSQQIKQLEETLDVQMLDRSGRNVRLTDAGEVYLRHARRALGELDAGQRAIHELQDLSRGSLRLAMTPITEYLATPLLDLFIRHHPGISISTFEMPQDEMALGISEDRVDLGIAFTNALASQTLSHDIDTHILFVETLNLAVGDGHPFAGRPGPLTEQVLEKEPLVLLNRDFALRRHFDLYCFEHGITPRIVMETNSLSVIVELVRLGRFVTILPDSIACSQKGLHPAILLPEMPRHEITLFCRKGAYLSPACRVFAELASEWCTARCELSAEGHLRPCPLSPMCNCDEDD